MNIKIKHGNEHYKADLSQPLDISIPLNEGPENPNCYYAPHVEFRTIRSGDFIGSVKEGGSINYRSIQITPHGNGTHTECYGHISSDKEATLNHCLTTFHFLAQVLTLTPRRRATGDEVIESEDLRSLFKKGVEAVIIRTLPNEHKKTTRQYSGTNPPYLDVGIADFLKEEQVKHLLIDLPSADKEFDDGALETHRSFWNMNDIVRKDATITELVYVNNRIADGLYLLNLQITSLECDASPSKPVIFKLDTC